MKRILSIICISLCVGLIFAQSISSTTTQVIADQMNLSDSNVGSTVEKFPDPQLAMSVPNYPVTCGDVYTLAFAAGSTPITYSIPVDTTYKIRVANLGVINAAGLSYQQLKQQVEALVQRNYPMGGVQFVLTTPATFLVTITGEVKSTTEKNAWALTRLSTFVSQSFTPYSSSRDITIVSTNGTKKSYDLFLATRKGDLSQDPYLRPGDKIIINRASRKVTITGAVERPGTYELLKGENLKKLIEYYGNGLTEYANTDKVSLLRRVNGTDKGGNQLYLEKDVFTKDYTLNHGDTVTIHSNTEYNPSIVVEGIIKNPAANADSADTTIESTSPLNTSYRQYIRFYNGENYATLIRRISNIFVSYSDLKNSYVERNKQKIALDIERILYDPEFVSEVFIAPDDRLVIPFQQHFQKILVNGEVNTVREEDAWPLRRLSTIIADNLTPYSSTRYIDVTSLEGEKTTYDLFMANRFGDMSQNPYIRAGETITINRMDRKVTIAGAVERPGTYEILPGENLKQLVDYYGHGLTKYANTDKITLLRTLDGENKAGNTIYLEKEVITEDYTLNHGDTVTIHSNTEYNPSIVVEGIIKNPAANADSADTTIESTSPLNTSYRQYIRFYNGENYATLIRRISNIFVSYSDLKNSYVERNKQKIALDIERILYDPEFVSEVFIAPDDRLVIPFQQHFQKILVNGEVNTVREEDAWPLRRLSTIIADNLTPYSSTRYIDVTSLEGEKTTYDLFMANRFGDMSQNPYIRAGETITINRMDRKVTIAGAVERPGTYEILPGENLKQLIEYYGNGLVPLADTSRTEIKRILNAKHEAGDMIYLKQTDIDNNYELVNYDYITISSFANLNPVVFVQGAAYSGDVGTTPSVANKITARFTSGENYAYFIRRNASWFSAESDTENAYIMRQGKVIPMNLNEMLYNAAFYSDLTVEDNDILMIPFKQYFVTVSGAVKNPGRFSYIPGRSWEYYIALAGGFDKTKNKFNALKIIDMNGNKIHKNDSILPETVIEAESNAPLYFFNQYAPVISTSLGIILSALSLWAVIETSKK